MLLLRCGILFLFYEEVSGYFFSPPSFHALLGSSCHLWNYQFFFSLSFSLCVPLNSLLPTSPGVHQATVRGGAETVRDLAAAATAWTSSTSGNGKAKSQLTCSVFIICVCTCVCLCGCPPNMPVQKRRSFKPCGPQKSCRDFIRFVTQFSESQYIQYTCYVFFLTPFICKTLTWIQPH